VTIFQILSGENWNAVMYDAMQAEGWTASLYFVAVMVVGNFVILNLFLAILMSNFEEQREFMKKLATGPDDENVVMIPGVKKLKADMDTYVTKALVHSCSRSESPSAMGEYVDTVGFIKKRENEWCGDEGMEPGSKTCKQSDEESEKKGCLHMFLGIAETASECYGWAIMNEAKYFAWNSGGGTTPNRGHCYAELTEDGDKCPEGWTERENVDFYKITNFGEGPSMDDDDMGPAGF